MLAEAQGRLWLAPKFIRKCTGAPPRVGDTGGLRLTLGGLGEIARQRGDLASGPPRHGKHWMRGVRIGDAPGAAGALLDLGLIRQLEGDYAGARTESRRAWRFSARLAIGPEKRLR